MDSLWFYVPLYIGLGFGLFGSIYRRRHPDSPHSLRVLALCFTVALIAVFGTTAWSMGAQIADGATGLIVPVILLGALGVLSLFTVRRTLSPRPVTTETGEHSGRRMSARLTMTLATITAMLTYGAGFGAGAWLMLIHPDAPQLDLILGVAAVLAVALSLIPWSVIEFRAAARRRTVADGHPSSPEIVEHVMTKATAARLDDIAGLASSPFRGLAFWGLGLFLILIIPSVMQLVVSQLGTDTASSIDISWVQTVAIGIALTMTVGVLISWLIVPLIREARIQLLLSALSTEQRLQWAQRTRDSIRPHRFPERLTDPHRSIRVLTITAGGATRLETIAAGDLLLEHSEPLEGADYDRSEDLIDDDQDAAKLDAADMKVLRTLYFLAHTAGDRSFDVFDDEDGREMHIVVAGDDDYLDFPEDLARNITATP